MAHPGLDFPGVGSGLAILRDGKVLLVKRLTAPEAGHWTIVGGKVDHMEPSAEAAKREAEEESGLSIHSVQFLCLSEHMIEADGQHWVSVIYATEDFSGEPRVMEPEKMAEMGWYDLNNLPTPLSRFALDALAALKHTTISSL